MIDALERSFMRDHALKRRVPVPRGMATEPAHGSAWFAVGGREIRLDVEQRCPVETVQVTDLERAGTVEPVECHDGHADRIGPEWCARGENPSRLGIERWCEGQSRRRRLSEPVEQNEVGETFEVAQSFAECGLDGRGAERRGVGLAAVAWACRNGFPRGVQDADWPDGELGHAGSLWLLGGDDVRRVALWQPLPLTPRRT